MKFQFRNDVSFTKIDFIVSNTWKCLERGEGEKEIENQGWSRVHSFSQETEAQGQLGSRSDRIEPKLNSQNQLQDAYDSPTQLPIFFLSKESLNQSMRFDLKEVRL